MSSADVVQRSGRGQAFCREMNSSMAAISSLTDVWAPRLMLFGQQGEEALDLVDPGRRCRREVLMPAGALGEPVADRLRLVARCVVHDDVHVEANRNVALDLIEELAELLGAMSRHALADHRAGLHVRRRCHRGDEAREQRRGAVALVIVRAPFDLPWTHWQQRLRAIESLYLALLILSLSKDHRRRSPAPCRADRDRARRC